MEITKQGKEKLIKQEYTEELVARNDSFVSKKEIEDEIKWELSFRDRQKRK